MKNINLGVLEKEVMDYIWEHNNCTIKDAHVMLSAKKKIAYTTVATVFQRLIDKNLVIRKGTNKGYFYKAKISRDKYSSNVAQSFLNNFINNFGDSAIASFAESIDKLPSHKRKNFLKLLDDHNANK